MITHFCPASVACDRCPSPALLACRSVPLPPVCGVLVQVTKEGLAELGAGGILTSLRPRTLLSYLLSPLALKLKRCQVYKNSSFF